MKGWSSALAGEMQTWPQVRSRAFFGFTALYRRDKIFALLPRTRALDTPNSVAFKLESPTKRMLARVQRDPRLGFADLQKTRWFTFEVADDKDLRAALDWFGQAYDRAG